ncbi:MAG: hypothetical protein B7Y80_20220 [Hyphomicrobium sp. 32-62-53]|nr:MAG: hypothetical protein B7Z29_16760 [Hyphomicrobium sp. 12-62-95]OYX97282.1 MAG: hypothetical protein B7Y80_20220 [Hyphomicrobium sp. 32-62-53]
MQLCPLLASALELGKFNLVFGQFGAIRVFLPIASQSLERSEIAIDRSFSHLNKSKKAHRDLGGSL